MLRWLKYWIFGKPKKKNGVEELSDVERFQNTLAFARALRQKNPVALPALVHSIVRSFQLQRVHFTMAHPIHKGCKTIDTPHILLFGPNRRSQLPTELLELMREKSTQVSISLADVPIIATPWNRDGLVSSLSVYGASGGQPWCYDSSNHNVLLLHPLNIGLVRCGNHSITAGFLHGQGDLFSDATLSLEPLLERVECNGRVWIDRRSGQEIMPMDSYEGGLLFELARLMV